MTKRFSVHQLGPPPRAHPRRRPHPLCVDVLTWTQTLLLEGELATVEPKNFRDRLLHAAARICLRIAATWPWPHELTRVFTRLVALPRPVT